MQGENTRWQATKGVARAIVESKEAEERKKKGGGGGSRNERGKKGRKEKGEDAH